MPQRTSRLSTLSGDCRSSVSPRPRLPNWFHPNAKTAPASVQATLCSAPHPTDTTECPCGASAALRRFRAGRARSGAERAGEGGGERACRERTRCGSVWSFCDPRPSCPQLLRPHAAAAGGAAGVMRSQRCAGDAGREGARGAAGAPRRAPSPRTARQWVSPQARARTAKPASALTGRGARTSLRSPPPSLPKSPLVDEAGRDVTGQRGRTRGAPGAGRWRRIDPAKALGGAQAVQLAGVRPVRRAGQRTSPTTKLSLDERIRQRYARSRRQPDRSPLQLGSPGQPELCAVPRLQVPAHGGSGSKAVSSG